MRTGTLELLHAPGEQRCLRGRLEDPQPWGPHEEYPDPRTTPGLYKWFFVPDILGSTMLVDGCLVHVPPGGRMLGRASPATGAAPRCPWGLLAPAGLGQRQQLPAAPSRAVTMGTARPGLRSWDTVLARCWAVKLLSPALAPSSKPLALSLPALGGNGAKSR